jgi:MarR family transcriptional regulator, 2-MHQ and catechol-resistance regulon repressor
MMGMGTHYQGPPEEVRALGAYVKLMRAADSVSARLAGPLGEWGLTETQFGALEALYHVGPMNQRDLGRKLLRSGGNVTMVVDNLEKRGLVRRERDADDRRFVTVHLTDAGRRLIARVFPRHAANVTAEFGVLTPAEQDELGRLCRKLGRQLR